jgi:hypothetical protein
MTQEARVLHKWKRGDVLVLDNKGPCSFHFSFVRVVDGTDGTAQSLSTAEKLGRESAVCSLRESVSIFHERCSHVP